MPVVSPQAPSPPWLDCSPRQIVTAVLVDRHYWKCHPLEEIQVGTGVGREGIRCVLKCATLSWSCFVH